jgi:hypothetical protein
MAIGVETSRLAMHRAAWEIDQVSSELRLWDPFVICTEMMFHLLNMENILTAPSPLELICVTTGSPTIDTPVKVDC